MKFKDFMVEADDKVSVDIKLTGNKACVERVLSLFGMIQFNGNVGHSGVFGISWDGDGSDKIKVEGPIPDHKEAWNATSSYGGYVEMMGEGGKSYHVR
jgi:hypothetical protein